MLNEWKIIPAEPEVLSFEEWMKTELFDEQDYTPGMKESFIAGEKYGQLKQWLNHNDLRELLKEWTSSVVVLKDYTERVEKALKNLKPLKLG